ncbi:cysteine-rich protein 2-binding protein-like isoform X1 [Daphnia pulex]|uniref:cysteine-rich protein 2-binding protein-like isoform X1 n=2 Tax=Daphnia pulex TaxID=6669 RepID=UPI001EDD676B|nr:cysteine-rich protein 2-binding protein-like isoform X1 [Daphnia pulex]
MPRGRKRGSRGGGRGRGRPPGSTTAAATRIDGPSVKKIKLEPQNTSSIFGSEDIIYGSNFDVFQEVIVEEEVQDINVENSRSNSPISVTNDSNSNENSVSSFSASDIQNKYWTREDLTPSDAPPENLFTENEDEMKSFALDMNNVDTTVNLNDETGFSLNSLFPIKEEPLDIEQPKSSENGVEQVKKASRRKIKQEPTETAPKLKQMSLYEEMSLFRQLRPLAEKNALSPELRRLYRKLSLRNTKRSIGLEPFNFDRLLAKLLGKDWSFPASSNEPASQIVSVSNVLDRFQKSSLPSCSSQKRLNISFRMRLLGASEDQIPQSFVSPYTGRTLKPFIRRDYESRPMKLKLLEEIRSKCSSTEIRNSVVKPIDYSYVQPQHIPAINAICKEFFWSGIDVTECLEYPDFSCVVLYGHVIIGFAFMVPDVSYNEAYISYLFTHPEWRGAGIAKFMLYHLIQSCMGKDVTLHVSATNPAMTLYHKFGFKVQEFVVDFYDKYFPADSTQCKHAFFMRLTR